MRNIFSLNTLKTHTVQNRFNIIIGLVIFILLFALLNSWFSVRVMSGIRAYVNGEGLWSKAQKEAVNSLVEYETTHSEDDYSRYLSFLKVQMGDKQARLELDKSQPDYTLVREGFIQGGNSPYDVNDLTFLYRHFHRVSYVHKAIQIWSQGDQEIGNLEALGTQMHTLVASSNPQNEGVISRSPLMTSLVAQTYATDAKLTVLENQFSATLGDGSRSISSALLRVTIVTTCLLGGLTIVIAFLVSRAIVHLDEVKTGLVSLVSHQLRTPLTAINWYADSLLNDPKQPRLTDQQRSYLEKLHDGGRRMSSLIDDLLSASSLELGTYNAEPSLMHIESVFKTVVKDLQPSMELKNISFTMDMDKRLPKAVLDEQLLTAVFQNLLSNSVKYTAPGGKIRVNVIRQKTFFLIHVADTGIGIPVAEQSQVFTKLFRADNAKIVDADGTGLGLYIARAMVERMGGRVWFTSVENQGTNFFVRLPLHGPGAH